MENSIWEYHIMGGIEYMSPIAILLTLNITLILICLVKRFQRKAMNNKLLSVIRQIGGLALAFGVLGTIVGFFQAFDALEKMKQVLPLYIIMGGLKVAIITAIYGLMVFCFSFLAYITLQLLNQKS